MAEICSKCGLPIDICVCGEIDKEQQKIKVRLETRKWGREVTIIDGIGDNNDLGKLTTRLKTFCACGGTSKNSQIMLQGDHRDKVKTFLQKQGYPQENLEIQ